MEDINKLNKKVMNFIKIEKILQFKKNEKINLLVIVNNKLIEKADELEGVIAELESLYIGSIPNDFSMYMSFSQYINKLKLNSETFKKELNEIEREADELMHGLECDKARIKATQSKVSFVQEAIDKVILKEQQKSLFKQVCMSYGDTERGN